MSELHNHRLFGQASRTEHQAFLANTSWSRLFQVPYSGPCPSPSRMPASSCLESASEPAAGAAGGAGGGAFEEGFPLLAKTFYKSDGINPIKKTQIT